MKSDKKIANIKDEALGYEENPNGKIVTRTLFVFGPIFLLMLLASILILYTQEKLEMSIYKSSEENIVKTKLENIESEFNHIIDDLVILTLNSKVEEIWNNDDNAELIKSLSYDFLNVTTYHKLYDQIRLIDKNGSEVIRVNFNNGEPFVVSDQELQNKKDRYYFINSIKLNQNEIYISPFDLNVEGGKIEQPLKPMIRIASPVFDKQGSKAGIVLVNYFGEIILNQVNSLVNPTINSQMMLLNSDGYWLKGSTPKDEWGFMYEDKQNLTFASHYPEGWARIKNEEAAQFETEFGLFTFKTIYPLHKVQKSAVDIEKAILSGETEHESNYNWKIVSFVPSKVLYTERNERRKQLALLLVFLSTSLLIISWRLAKAQYYRRKALQSLKISNETKDKFFSIISHDLRGPFNSLLGFTGILVENYDVFEDKERKEIIESLNKTSKNTYQLLENLLTWSRSQTGRIKFEKEKIELKLIIGEVISLCNTAAENKSIELIERAGLDLNVFADKNMLYTVLQNLISNAIKFTECKGSIIVSTKNSNQEGFIELSVSDSGVGIPEDIIDDLFLMDKSVTTLGTEKEKGTGLGLILCKEFVEKQGGKIWVESKSGEGSQFIFTLPKA